MGYPKGRPRTEEQKRAHSERMKGRVFTEEHRRKMSEAAKARWDRARGIEPPPPPVPPCSH